MSDYTNLAAKIHIHILQVIQVGDLWTAIIQISLEPDLEKELKEEKELERLGREKRYEKKDVEEKPELKAKFAGEEVGAERSKFEIPTHEPSVHIYIPSLLEPGYLYEPHHYIGHPNYHFHFLEPGSSFWEASLKIIPDFDFYETAENIPQLTFDTTPEDGTSPALELKKTRKPKGLDLSLTEEI